MRRAGKSSERKQIVPGCEGKHLALQGCSLLRASALATIQLEILVFPATLPQCQNGGGQVEDHQEREMGSFGSGLGLADGWETARW